MLKGKTPLVVALVLGLLAGIVAYSAIKKKESDVRRGWNLVPVVVAGQDMPEGSVITYEMISQRSVPEQFVTSSVVKPDSANYIVNQKVLVALQAGDPILWSQFETTKAAERLSTKVQKKARAVTIEAKQTTAVGGWIRPNDHVDIIGTFRDPQTDESVAVTLLQNIIVVATGKITGTTNINLIPENQREYSNVSLMVLPEEAEILVLAAELGQLTLSLRNEDDVDLIEERGRATISTLLSGERTRVLEQKRREIIQIIKGSGSGEKASAGAP
ncbi:Flp pilus assembly protein CpaB [Corallococcus sp. CA054B]|uniref:Putative Flp pilus assembly protein CpaB n=1 Tax=Corallococcus coralloides (strain ATCC 25202 / DSM 2259 / NBRC 100086 / M2) TaxID=1144275 RepID=H8MM75_CORCM|nr:MULTISPECIES: Flp pilus assembly protein CpaB [Corallococcus]AFE06064.1 putative Flp pilus assembly protein CpaB [Corallococcus coralloides DSM 2259]RKG60103.1 Flp pilus assembly protein CpaB [Corallococcus sp. CA054B]